MTRRRLLALAHGGAEADPAHADGPRRAAEAAVAVMAAGGTPLDAVVEAVRLLEDDARFNAGLGSNLRLDGRTVHMDAALADSRGRFAGVIGLHDVRNPVLVARDLLQTPHPVLAAPGATRFARRMGHPPFDPRTAHARDRLRRLGEAAAASGAPPAVDAILPWWNYAAPPARAADAATPARDAPPGADTVGAVASDGETFAAAASTGGLAAVLDGRVSDVALPGCGIDAGAGGATCVTGAGDHIVRARVASRVLRRVDGGATPEDAAAEALSLLPPGLPLALLVVAPDGRAAARGRAPFPWGRAEG